MNNTIVITGGTSGIGAAVIERLRAKGCALTNLDIKSAGRDDVDDVFCDLARKQSIESALVQLPETFDTLIHVAGIAPGQASAMDQVAVNFLGLRHLTEQALPRLRQGGRIVIVASSAGRDWQTNEALVSGLLDTVGFDEGAAWLAQNEAAWSDNAYKFAKQCAAAYTYRASGLGRVRAITVNCVNPGITDTQLSSQFRDMLGAARYDWIVEQTGRAGTPEDVAPIVEFLALGDCKWLNGVEITVDGGYYAGLVGGAIDADQMPE